MESISRRRVLHWGAAAGAVGMTATKSAAGARQPANSVRVLSWNIYRGGNGVGPRNLPQLLDHLVAIGPDAFLCVETYGSGEQIRRALSDRVGRGQYTGVQITARPPGSDNLWIFTRLPIVHVYPKPTGGQHITDFNLGGVRVRLPNGRQLNLFDIWISYTNPWIGYLIDENAAGIRAGLTPRHTPEEVVHADRIQTAYLREVVHQHLPAMLAGNTDPLVVGGDFNTLPAMDWTPKWADCPNHLGMSYDLTGTKVMEDAAFVDAFRAVHPDACTDEGRTWSPLPTERLICPDRIDIIYSRGDMRTRDAFVSDARMRGHGPGTFYSDHAAVVTDLDLS